MKAAAVFAAVVLFGWAAVKAVSLAVRGLVHLLVAGLPVLGAVAGSCLLLVLGARVTAWTRRRSPQPSGPPAAPARRTAPVVPAPVLSPERPVRPPAPVSRPAQSRWQPGTGPGPMEASPDPGAAQSGTPPAGPGAGPAVPGFGAAALGYAVSAGPGGNGRGSRETVHLTGAGYQARRLHPGPPGAALPSQGRAAHMPLSSGPVAPRPGNVSRRAKGMAMTGKGAGAPRRGGSGDPDAAGVIRTVVLIDGCSGVQYGRDNEQYSVYRVTLPPVALESTDALARHLLSGDRQWSGDMFDHDGRASFAGLPGPGSAFSGAAETVTGDTLVIVRNSRGVQVGDGNTQHNKFRIRVASVTIRAMQVGPAAASPAAVSRLCQQPSPAAAEAVARQIADAAREHLVVDLTAQVTREVGNPVIHGQPAEISGRTGVQAGGSARARVRVVVDPATVKVDRVAAVLLRQARSDLAARERAAQARAAAARASEARAPALTTPSRVACHTTPAPTDLPADDPARIGLAVRPPVTGAGPALGGISLFG